MVHGEMSWYQAVLKTATNRGIALPPIASNAMGTVVWRASEGDRAVTLKRRLLQAGTDDDHAILWGIWFTDNDVRPVLVCSESKHPNPGQVLLFVTALKSWIVDRVSIEELRRIVDRPSFEPTLALKQFETRSSQAFSFGDVNQLALEVGRSSWSLLSRDRLLTRGRTLDGLAFSSLPLPVLDNFAKWLTANWDAICFSTDTRPLLILKSSASACRAYEVGKLHARSSAGDLDDLQSWWSRHAIRAADGALPNLFIERQEDDIVISWDSSPSETAAFWIGSGVDALPADFAVPRLRELLQCRLNGPAATTSPSRDAQFGYQILKSYRSQEAVSPDWLAAIGFSDDDSAQFAIAGTSRHPVVGLLRSSRATTLSLIDIQAIIQQLHPATAHSYELIRSLAQGLDSQLDPREPWESGYELARRIRGRLSLSAAEEINIDELLVRHAVECHALGLADATIRGACVGSPRYCPSIILNTNCPEASGMSGRRITLAHELCHLLFDRSRMRGLARVEGGNADSDRLVEMRANAFAVELLLPMENLVDEDGNFFEEAELRRLAEQRGISFHALSAHADNLRQRLA